MMLPTAGGLKVFLDCGNYFGDNTNLGDEAVLEGISEGFVKHLPQARIRIATFAEHVIRRACPDFEPQVLHHREDRYSAAFAELISEADVVGVVLTGAFSDAFVEHAMGLLYTLELTSGMGKPTIVLSAGFERVTDPQLLARAKQILPRVDWIGCRENAEGPALLREWGVPESRILITGDAALPGSYSQAQPSIGGNVGISLRLTPYSGLDETFLPQLEEPLTRFASACEAELVPVPISLEGPSDLSALARICGSPKESSDAYDLARLAAAISGCRVVVSGSYHAAVFALGQGIPVVAVGESLHYRTKMAGLQAMFPEGCRVLHPGDRFSLRLAREVERQWVEAPATRPVTLDRVREQIRVQEEAWKHMAETITRSLDQRKPALAASR
jgi:polysaccharide pyruvyl transferase WcaK-like protein